MSLQTLQPRPPGQLNPERHSLVVGGRVAVAIRLYGKHAGGRCMTIDETDWTRVRLVIGERWHVARIGEREYVTAYAGKAGLIRRAGVTLARWLTWAEPSEVVGYRDGDTLNLCRGNLVTMGRGEFLEQYRLTNSNVYQGHDQVEDRDERVGQNRWQLDS